MPGQGTVRQVAATVKLIEYPSLLGNRDTNAVIGNFQCELVAMQAAFYPDTDGASRIFHGIFHQITDDICHVHGVGRNQQVVREMCLERTCFPQEHAAGVSTSPQPVSNRKY